MIFDLIFIFCNHTPMGEIVFYSAIIGFFSFLVGYALGAISVLRGLQSYDRHEDRAQPRSRLSNQPEKSEYTIWK